MMRVVAVLALLLFIVRLSTVSAFCHREGNALFCSSIPTAFLPGSSTLLLTMKNVGVINSTVLRSDDLASFNRLVIIDAGVTGIAEGAFGSFHNLTSLSLGQNSLTEISPNWFSRPEILRDVTMTENQIEALNVSMLGRLTGLTKLSLNKNRIRTIGPNSFSSLTMLAELDLSDNQLTWVSPQVFRSLRSTRIALGGNPWDCSCEAEDFVNSIKDLQSRSLLDSPLQVTCESPPPLKGRPVWNVSVCVTSPPTRPPSATPPVQANTTDTFTTVPLSTGTNEVVTSPPSHPTSGTETSAHPKPSDAPSSHTAAPPAWSTSETKTSVQPKPTDILTTVPASTGTSATSPAWPTSETQTSVQPKPTDTLTTTTAPAPHTETHVMSPPSVTETSVHPKSSDLSTYSAPTPTGMSETCTTPRPLSDTSIVCTLVIVIVVLSVLLSVVCFLVVFHRRKRNNKAVMPGCPKENRNESREEDSRSRSSCTQAPGRSEKRQNNQWDSETGWRRSFNGVRAKSADAVLFTSPFCAPVRNQVTLQTETEAQSKDQSEGKQKQGSEPEDETENLTNSTDVNAKQGEPRCGSVNTDAVPYLSIGTNQSKPDDFNQQSADGPEQRSMTRKAMGRISTWPPTAVQWQARCKMMVKGEEEEGSDVFTIWTPKSPGEVKKEFNKTEHPSASDQDKKDEDAERNQIEDLLKINMGHSSKPNDITTSVSEAHVSADRKQEEQLKEKEMIQDPATVKHTISGTQILNREKFGPKKHLIPAESPAEKNTAKSEPKRAVTSRQRADNRSTQSSKAPSGGASPDDETLLSGNEYAFMDLLHEVAQNNGRWTRDRWKQIHANRQRR